MHVFVDTNIFLNFYHFSKEDLDSLKNVFASHQHGAATVHLTEQVRDEFRRNRETKISDALKQFKSVSFAPQMPAFMKAYDEYTAMDELSAELQEKRKSILAKAEADVAKKALIADALIKDIFTKSKIVSTDDTIYSNACRRMKIGNPPGKNNSIGDSINWLVLLGRIPDGKDLHIISADGDFFSKLDERRAHPFLEEEWQERKKSKLRVYRTLSDFLKAHFDGVAFSFDADKDAWIDKLARTGSFIGTHNIVAELESYGYYSLKEVERILEAAKKNDQFGWIVTDHDVSDFLNRVAVPRRPQITNTDYIAIIDKVIAEQANRI
jgi:hypothetical protein